jgi:hypothetical protein
LRNPFLSKGLIMLVEGKMGRGSCVPLDVFLLGAEKEEDTYEG